MGRVYNITLSVIYSLLLGSFVRKMTNIVKIIAEVRTKTIILQ